MVERLAWQDNICSVVVAFVAPDLSIVKDKTVATNAEAVYNTIIRTLHKRT